MRCQSCSGKQDDGYLRKLLVSTYVNEKARPACCGRCMISIPLGIKVYLAGKPVSTRLGLPPSRAAAAAEPYSPVCDRQDSA